MPITEYKNNSAGLNISDSPLTIKDEQATGQSYNYDYSRTGAISKVLAPGLINTVADTQLKSLGLHVHHSVTTDVRTVIRAAGTKIQTFDTSTAVFTNLSEDTLVSNSDFLTSGSTQPVVGAQFNSASVTQLWLAGGGMSGIYGYNGTNITKNGTVAPTGAITPVLGSSADGGIWTTTGTYFYSVLFRKLGTQAQGNAALDVSITVDDTTKKVTIGLTGITNNDTTKYDKIYLYRSAVSGVSEFTSGDLVAIIASTATSYVDNGDSLLDAQVVPRAVNTTDNSMLATGTYKHLVPFKRRLVTCLNSTVYLSDQNKPESWPTVNTFTIPSGGPITGLGVIGYNSPFTTGADEYLVIFKETETWVFTGTDTDDWELKFVDQVGCIGQSYIVALNGYISWMDYRGVYLWDGHGKPIYASRPIEALFAEDGDLDKTKMMIGWGRYFPKLNQIIWCVSHRTKGEQKILVKMDVRLTVPQIAQGLDTRVIEGVFILDSNTTSFYSGATYRASNYDERLIIGDDAGYVYTAFSSASGAVAFDYETRPLDMGAPAVMKRFNRILVWVERLTDNDLTCNYWVDYRNRSEDKSTVRATMAPRKGAAAALWDVAIWDTSYWDDYLVDIDVIEFHVHSNENNGEGTTLKLQFEQLEASAPVRIHGFAVDWEPMGTVNKGAA